ncbi:MAG: PAS domain-containing protein [Gammaproteobacteria bacterium]|nr:PAS domain-containing protein [Gammaproteobacteria bacterium]
MTEYTAPLPTWRPALALYRLLARYPLRVTFPAIMAVGFALLLIDTYVHEFDANRRHALAQMATRVVSTSNEMTAQLAHSLLKHHAGDVTAAFEALTLDPDFEAAVLVDTAGNVLAASGAQETGASFDKSHFGLVDGREPAAGGEVRGSRFYAVTPVMAPAADGQPPREIGRLYRRDRTEAALAAASVVARREATRHGLEFAVVLLLLWWVGDRVYRARLGTIEAAAQAVSGGEFGVRVTLNGEDELANLAQAFNHMVARLESDKGILLEQSQTLATTNAELDSLRKALDAHAIVSITDEFGDIVHANDKFCEISGYSRAELLGNNHRLLKSDAHGEEAYRQLWNTILDGQAWHGVLQNRRKDGAPYWVQSSILPLVGRGGRHGGYISLRTDITERERLRLALDRLARIDVLHDPFDLFAEALAYGIDASAAGVVRFVENNQRQRLLGSWPQRAEFEESEVLGSAAAIRDGAPGFSQCACLNSLFPDDPLLAGHDHECLYAEPIIDLAGKPIGMLYALRRCRPTDEASTRALLGTVARRAAAEIQRQSMERAQARQQVWLEFVIQGAAAGVWDWDLTTDAVQYNETWARMLGYELSELRHHVDTWKSFIHPDDIEHAIAAVAAHIAGNCEHYESEHRLRKKDGSYIWVLDRGTVTVRTPEGRALRMSGVHMDITRLKNVQDALVAEQERLQLVLDNVPIGLWELDLESGAATTSSQWLTRLGFSAAAHPHSRDDWANIIHVDDRERVRTAFGAYLHGETAGYAVEFRISSGNGKWHWVLSRGVVTARGEDGRALRLIGIHLDINDKKRTEAALIDSEARLRAVLDNSPIGIFWTDSAGALQYLNASLRKNFELDAEQGMGDSWREFIHPEDRPRVIASWNDYVSSDAPVWEIEYRAVFPKVSMRIVHVRVARTHGAGSSLGFVGALEDITEARTQEVEHERLRLQIQQAQKMEAVGQLAGGIAHDFNNILASVIGFGTLARDRFAQDPSSKLAEYLNAVVTAGERGRDVVAKMLAFSRAAPSGQSQAIEPVAVAREVAHLLSTIIPSSIEFKLEVREPVPPIAMDAVDLHQVLVNLVVNARDAVDSHGHIVIRIDDVATFHDRCAACQMPVDGDYVAISVSDDGAGMDAATLTRIFDPFYTTKEVGKGSGMGLSVVHGIMHRADGHILVRSEPGVGTEFVLLFRPAHALLEGTAVAEQRAVAVTGLRVLVVDDEPLIRNFVNELLLGEGAHPTLVANGLEARTLFAAHPENFDVVFTDQTMPGLTGLELTAKLREVRADVPVVLYSGYTDTVTREVARAGGVVFLGKPAEPQALLSALQTAAA